MLVAALGDPALGVRKVALELVESLGPDGAAFLEDLKERNVLEEEVDGRDALARLVGRRASQAGAGSQPVTDGGRMGP